MEDQLVTFKVANLAKEKGFDEVCIDTFSSEGKEQDRYNLSMEEGMSSSEIRKEFEVTNTMLDNIVKLNHPPIPYIARPSQSLLQKWLREIENIEVYSIKDMSRKWSNNYYNYFVYLNNTLMLRSRIGGTQPNTYEEALEVGLFEALNL